VFFLNTVYTDCQSGRTAAIARHVRFAQITCSVIQPGCLCHLLYAAFICGERSLMHYKQYQVFKYFNVYHQRSWSPGDRIN